MECRYIWVGFSFIFFYLFRSTLIFHFSFRPHETPFEDGTFKLTLVFTEEYPNKPPIVRFVSKMFHPNGMLFTLIIF
jgi:hypothetical protein